GLLMERSAKLVSIRPGDTSVTRRYRYARHRHFGIGAVSRIHPSHAQPGPLRHVFSREMQLSPQAFPFEHVLQQP
ncbi:hypothetical protein AAAK29_25655, partial [Mesorhizobium sp. CCNWLW179-1]|uniref:hypothetical protein n=1 Tax=unclassified Mesorhizobium TaxID=325217 RepID=UPI0030148C09